MPQEENKCTERDLKDLIKTGRATLYLRRDETPDEKGTLQSSWLQPDTYIVKDRPYKVTNQSGSLVFIPTRLKIGRHNIAHTRYDVWFKISKDAWWHGVLYGNGPICHCKRIKG